MPTTFWDLPKTVRDKIYRLHLVHDEPVTIEDHRQAIAYDGPMESNGWRGSRSKRMPPIFHLSKQAEREAVPFYYGMNTFDIGNMSLWRFNAITWPRHWNRVQRLVCSWEGDGPPGYGYKNGWGQYGVVREAFIMISKMRSLEHLKVRIDESDMVYRMCRAEREERQNKRLVEKSRTLTSQQNLAILRFPGITGLLALSKIKHVEFAKLIDSNGVESGGMIPGGALETHILPRLRPKLKAKRKQNDSFRFLELPPELRNRVYDLLLRIDGPINPSKKPPTSAPKNADSVKLSESTDAESALSILAVCKQIHDEAVGIYYCHNSFVFHYPVQMSAFLIAIGTLRIKFIRDITLYYYNTKSGGIDLIDVTMPLLRQMTGLRKLHILMVAHLENRNARRGWLTLFWGRFSYGIDDANPALVPGMSTLFDLRGITDLKVSDVSLENEAKELQKDKAFPDFPSRSRNADIMQMSKAFEHFNAALADAQLGKVNRKLLENKKWHTWDVFPTLESDGMEKAE